MTPPVIGLSTYREEAAWGVWHQPADLLPAAYADVVAATGGVPVLLPPALGGVETATAAEAVVARLDGLLLCGGADIEPARYAAERDQNTTTWREDRDAWELALLDAAARIDLPLLGVCRGMQLMAVHAGGTLDQHVPDVVGSSHHSPTGPTYSRVRASTTPGSRLAVLIGSELEVACHHHQSVRTHPGYSPVARAADGLLEAIELPGERFCLGVQWHPETTTDVRLVTGLVRAAAGRTGSRTVRMRP